MITEKISKWLVLFSIMIVSFYLLNTYGCKKQEHPEDPEVKVSMEELADAMENYIEEQAAEHGGTFVAVDDMTGEILSLTLDKVHRERVAMVGEDTYFACADFTAEGGTVYDLDIFMIGPDKDSLVFSEISVHKENGVERYTWYEEGGVWKKKIEGMEEVAKLNEEHPRNNEHPRKKEGPDEEDDSDEDDDSDENDDSDEDDDPKKEEHPKT